MIGDGTGLPITHMGSISLHTPNTSFQLNNVLCVPTMKKNLISISQFCLSNNVSIEFSSSSFIVKDLRTGTTLLKGKTKDGVYEWPSSTSIHSPLLAFSSVKTTSSQWHHRLGHPASPILQHILSHYQINSSTSLSSDFLCNACHCNKSHKLSFSNSFIVSSRPLQIIFSDVLTSPVLSNQGFKYYVIFVDHFTKYIWFYPLKHKSEVKDVFIRFKAIVEKHFTLKICTLYSDNGGEYLEVDKKCLGSSCPKNFWSSFKLGKKVSGNTITIVNLLGEGRNFDSMAYRAPRVRVDEMPIGHTVGLDWLYEKVCSCLTEDKVGIIGLYGTGGVGKTTLMKKINNEFLKTKHQSGVVIWVSLSKQASVRTAQEVIRNKLQIPDSIWQGRTEDERAREIFNIMKTKRFVLLLDDVWQRLDLLEIGVPPLPLLDDENKSKVIIMTRFMRICSDMEVQVTFKVNCLTREEALALFLKKVGEDTLSSHLDIPNLAEVMIERCQGLPLALVTVGRVMANRNTPQEWEHAIQELEKNPSEISRVENQLFDVLKLIYGSIRDDITKSCFLYLSVFPKEYEVRNDELIEHWIGEGFFDGKDIYEARRRGHKIIEDRKNACLLEAGDGFKECIKMHDVIHDMALWIAQECGNRINKTLVCESVGKIRVSFPQINKCYYSCE